MLGPQRIKVGLEQHLEGAQVDEIAYLHHLHQGFLVDDAVKDLPQRLAITAFRGGGHADDQWPVWAPGVAILQDASVRGSGRVVRFVNDDGLEIRHEAW